MLSEPVIFPFRAKATAKGGGKDKLTVLAGFAADGDAPASAPDTTVSFGDFAVTVPGAEFTPKGPGVFVAKNPPSAPGVKTLTVDYARELVSLKAAGVDLGAIAEGAFDVVISVTLDGETRSVQVTAVRAGKQIRY